MRVFHLSRQLLSRFPDARRRRVLDLDLEDFPGVERLTYGPHAGDREALLAYLVNRLERMRQPLEIGALLRRQRIDDGLPFG